MDWGIVAVLGTVAIAALFACLADLGVGPDTADRIPPEDR